MSGRGAQGVVQSLRSSRKGRQQRCEFENLLENIIAQFSLDKIESLIPTNTKRGYTVAKAQVFDLHYLIFFNSDYSFLSWESVWCENGNGVHLAMMLGPMVWNCRIGSEKIKLANHMRLQNSTRFSLPRAF